MKRVFYPLTIIFLIVISGISGYFIAKQSKLISIKSPASIPKSRPLDKYTIENLSQIKIESGNIQISEIVKEEKNYTSHIFTFEFDPEIEGKVLKTTTGQINIPNKTGSYPIVLMLRGYVDQELYKTGDGTRRAAGVFADNDFITIAPDFLGYADSDSEAGNIFEARFQTYVTVLSLLKTIEELPNKRGLLQVSDDKSLNQTQLTNQLINRSSINIWGHSNGGQIALAVLEITQATYPTTLWAPVSKPFPYSILYYTDESEDRGKFIRKELAKFEDLYNVELYSIDNYFDQIQAPIQIHQGTADDAVPQSWSNELYEKLKDLEIEVSYYPYTGADHNMVPNWNTVIERGISFFKNNIKY